MRAKDLMSTDVVTIREDAPVSHLCDVMQAAHANGLPVLNGEGELVGVVTEDDILYGTMGVFDKNGSAVLVRDIMTSPAVCATEDTDVVELSPDARACASTGFRSSSMDGSRGSSPLSTWCARWPKGRSREHLFAGHRGVERA